MRLADPPNTTPRCLEKLPFAPDSTVYWRRRAAAPPFERPLGQRRPNANLAAVASVKLAQHGWREDGQLKQGTNWFLVGASK